jgi:hypothetical protein
MLDKREITELKVLQNQVNRLKKIVESRDIEIKKLRKELSKVSQDRSNTLLTWAEIDDKKE